MNVTSKLKKLVESWNMKPFLFVGAGVSFRYYDLPKWDQLLIDLSKYAKPGNEFAYAGYLNRAKQEIIEKEVTYSPQEEKFLISPLIAQYISLDFNHRFIEQDSTCINDLGYTGEYNNKIMKGEVTPFEILVKYYLESKSSKTSIYINEVDELIKISNYVQGFITTNYDDFLEKHFSNYQVCIGHDELFNHRFASSGVIYKIHGSLGRPESIVLTTQDYKAVDEKSHYLASKLLTNFIESPIIFIGYSISDLYIKNIIRDISICLNDENKKILSNQLIFIGYAESEAQESISYFEESGLLIKQFNVYDYNFVYKAIQSATTGLNVGMLRIIEGQIVELLKTKDPSKAKVYYASDLSNPHLSNESLGIFIASKDKVQEYGYSSYNAIDIYENCIFENKNFDSQQLIDKTIPSIKHNIANSKLPLYKYLDELSTVQINNIHKYLIDELSDLNIPSLTVNLKEVKDEIRNLEEILKLSLKKGLEINLILNKLDILSLDEIKQYVVDNFSECIQQKSISSNFRKIITAYDYLSYKMK